MIMGMPDLGNAFSRTYVITRLGETVLIEANYASHNSFLLDVFPVDSNSLTQLLSYPIETHIAQSLAELNTKIQRLVYKWSSWARPMSEFNTGNMHPVS